MDWPLASRLLSLSIQNRSFKILHRYLLLLSCSPISIMNQASKSGQGCQLRWVGFHPTYIIFWAPSRENKGRGRKMFVWWVVRKPARVNFSFLRPAPFLPPCPRPLPPPNNLSRATAFSLGHHERVGGGGDRRLISKWLHRVSR